MIKQGADQIGLQNARVSSGMRCIEFIQTLSQCDSGGSVRDIKFSRCKQRLGFPEEHNDFKNFPACEGIYPVRMLRLVIAQLKVLTRTL